MVKFRKSTGRNVYYIRPKVRNRDHFINVLNNATQLEKSLKSAFIPKFTKFQNREKQNLL